MRKEAEREKERSDIRIPGADCGSDCSAEQSAALSRKGLRVRERGEGKKHIYVRIPIGMRQLSYIPVRQPDKEQNTNEI